MRRRSTVIHPASWKSFMERETVSRAMKEFQEEGLIRVERRRIAVANRDALEKRAQVRM